MWCASEGVEVFWGDLSTGVGSTSTCHLRRYYNAYVACACGLHPHTFSAQALYRHMARQILSALSKGEAKAVQSGAEPILPELHVGEGFDAEQVRVEGTGKARGGTGAAQPVQAS